jgi:hypothetical protein
MQEDDGESLSAIGFLTVIEREPHGLFGGYLVLNRAARPLEFHCTAPVKANRAQEILYGPTLRPYLYGEQIGQTLVAKSKLKVPLVLTDVEPALAMRGLVAPSVALVCPNDDEEEHGEIAYRVDGPHRGARLATFRVGRHRLALPAGRDEEGESLARQLETVLDRLDLAEPFERIRDAIDEARK